MDIEKICVFKAIKGYKLYMERDMELSGERGFGEGYDGSSVILSLGVGFGIGVFGAYYVNKNKKD